MKYWPRKNFFILFCIVVANGCSTYIDYLEKDKSKIVFREQKVKTICEATKEDNLVLFGENTNSVKEMKRFLKLDYNKRLSFAEKAVLWALANLNTNPYLSHPFARFQMVFQNSTTPHYVEYSVKAKNPDTEKYSSYLTALERYLEASGAKRSLFQLAKHLDQYFESRPRVEADFANFLAENKGSIAQNKKLKNRFFKADQILQERESLRKLKFAQLLRRYKVDRKLTSLNRNDHLFNLSLARPNQKAPQNIRCNFDPGLYKNDIFLITPYSQKGHAFGIMNDQGQLFMGISSTQVLSVKDSTDPFFLNASSSDRPLPVCLIEGKQKLLVLSSLKGRDPGQYLYNLINYQIGEVTSLQEVGQYLAFPRHIFLPAPVRMLYESHRGTKEQLQNFLKTGFPIYHYPKLGKIWAMAWLNKGAGVVIDSRDSGYSQCKLKK